MAYVTIPTRTTADANAAADINQLQANLTYFYDKIRVNSGYVGIGTASPDSLLEISGASDTNLKVTGGTVETILQSIQTTLYGWVGTATNHKLFIGTNGTSVMSILTDGKVGIGTIAPDSKLELSNAGNLQLKITETGNSVETILQSTTSYGWLGTITNHQLYIGTNNASVMSILTDGKVGIGDSTPSYQLELSTDSAAKPSTNTWTVPSDKRLKEEIEFADLDICYNDIKSIPLKRFKWKDDCYTSEQVRDRHIIAWLADDVQKVIPKAVEVRPFKKVPIPDGFENIEEKDENGKILIVKKEKFYTERIEDALCLNSGQIISAMFGAIQKLQIIVEEQEKRIKKLEG